MEVTPVVVEMGPMIGVAVCVAIAAAMEDGRGAKAATMDRNATASEPTTVERRTAAPEAAAMNPAAAEATAVKSAAAKATASTATKTAAAVAAMLNLGRQSIGCVFC